MKYCGTNGGELKRVSHKFYKKKKKIKTFDRYRSFSIIPALFPICELPVGRWISRRAINESRGPNAEIECRCVVDPVRSALKVFARPAILMRRRCRSYINLFPRDG